MLLNWNCEKESFAIKPQFLIIGYSVGDTWGSKNSGRAVGENCSTCYSLLSLLFTYERCDAKQSGGEEAAYTVLFDIDLCWKC